MTFLIDYSNRNLCEICGQRMMANPSVNSISRAVDEGIFYI